MHISSTDINGETVILVGLNQHNLLRVRTQGIVLTQATCGAVLPPGIRIVLYGGKTQTVLGRKLAKLVDALIFLQRRAVLMRDLATSRASEHLRKE